MIARVLQMLAHCHVISILHMLHKVSAHRFRLNEYINELKKLFV
jgi:hypothetical protein